MEIYQSDFAVRAKEDESPVTLADEKAEAIITESLLRLAPGVPVVAEEAAAAGHLPDVSAGLFWLVDPLDGTKSFVRREGEFTVNIALVENGAPRMGVVFGPGMDALYAAAGPGSAIREKAGEKSILKVRAVPEDGLTVVASRSHGDPKLLDDFLAARKIAKLAKASSSMKFCVVAEGEADVYPRFGPTSEWDTAAGHAVLSAAGGRVLTEDGKPFLYGKPGFKNPNFIAWGAPEAK